MDYSCEFADPGYDWEYCRYGDRESGEGGEVVALGVGLFLIFFVVNGGLTSAGGILEGCQPEPVEGSIDICVVEKRTHFLRPFDRLRVTAHLKSLRLIINLKNQYILI